MTKVILLRHGQTEWNILGKYQGKTDVPLSAEGKAQARQLAEHFPVSAVDAVYSSDLSRAAFTAKCIAEKFNLPVNLEPQFREIDFGEWEGLSFKEIAARYPYAADGQFWQKPDEITIPGGETFAALQTRAMTRLNEIIAAADGKTIAVAAHGAINRVILAEALHMNLRYVWSIRQFNTAVNIIVYDGVWRTVELINGTAHLTTGEHKEKT